MFDLKAWSRSLLAVTMTGLIFAGGGYWKGHHDADQSATVAAQAKQLKALSAANNLYRQTTQTLAGISQDAKNDADLARAAARAADTSADGLRKRVAELVAASRHSAVTGTGSSADDSADPLDLLAGLLGRTDDAAGRIAEFADAAHIAGLACERSYDALIGSGPDNGR